ncbi:unnamed protein product [Discula destructiva]
MDTAPEPVDRDVTTPFLLKLYYRTGAFHRPDEFSSPNDLPPHITLHTWPTATLGELTHLLAAASSTSAHTTTTTTHLLPTPAIGTRLEFRHLYHDLRAGAGARLATQDLGSVVIGAGGPGAIDEDAATAAANTITDERDGGRLKQSTNSLLEPHADDAAKTLAAARFVAGDILSVAILPPSAVDGSVAAAGAAKVGRGYGVGSGLGLVGSLGGEAAGNGRVGGPAPSGLDGRGRWGEREGRGAALPMGEWKRGERLPDAPSVRGRGRGRPRW